MPRRCVYVSWYYTIPVAPRPTSCGSTCGPTSPVRLARAMCWIKRVAPFPDAPGEGRASGMAERAVGVSCDLSSAHRFLHERADPRFCGRGQLLQRKGDRPQATLVEVRRVAEAKRRVPRLELLRVLEEADDLAVLVVRGHPVPEFRREVGRAGFDDRVDPLRHGAIRAFHLGDLREQGACVLLLGRGRLPLFDALLHRGSFLVREYAALLVRRGGALGGLLSGPRWAHRKLLRFAIRLLRVWLIASLRAVTDPPDVAVGVREGTTVPAPLQLRRGLEDLRAGLLCFVHHLVNSLFAANDVVQGQAGEAAALRVHADIGRQPFAPVEAHE